MTLGSKFSNAPKPRAQEGRSARLNPALRTKGEVNSPALKQQPCQSPSGGHSNDSKYLEDGGLDRSLRCLNRNSRSSAHSNDDTTRSDDEDSASGSCRSG